MLRGQPTTVVGTTDQVAGEIGVDFDALSAAELAGSASTIISRTAFDLAIPEVRNVANVEENVELYIDFVACS